MNNQCKKTSILLDAIRGNPLTLEDRTQKTLDLAAQLMRATNREKTAEEKKRERWMGRMMNDPKGRIFMTAMTDQCFRSTSNQRTADQLIYLIKRFGIPHFLPQADRLKFLIFRIFGRLFSNLLIPKIKKQIRKEFSSVLLPEDPEQQALYFSTCQKKHIRINLNHLGEAILGEKEAERRLQVYLEDLANPQIEYISIKMSTIFSQINLIGWDETLSILTNRLRRLYREAQKHHFQRADGSEVEKFINLDMEEYKDLDLTVAVFQTVLNETEFFSYYAGIVLQSYLPNSFAIQQKLTTWALKRIEKGGAPIKIRLVKGANLALEKVESSIMGWEQAPFLNKSDSDANLKRMLDYGTQKMHAKAVHIGLGSHNLFDIAYCLILRAEREVEPYISFEMLEGMAEPLRRVILQLSGEILLYCPETKEQDFQNVVAYLIRRLDENCGNENFLRHFFEIEPNNAVWDYQVDCFLDAINKMESLDEKPRRTQNRYRTPVKSDLKTPFQNEQDTDFSLEENRKWMEEIYTTYQNKSFPNIPLVIAGKEIEAAGAQGIDPSKPHQFLYEYTLANERHLKQALECAKQAVFENRYEILGKAANLFRQRWNQLVGVMIADAGKTVAEADPEVSEAIDFIEYYRKSWERILSLSEIEWSAKGTVLVASPWNFPCSIPVGGIAAALTCGNSVIFKPAPETVLLGWEIVRCFWDAGVPKEALQFINCVDEPIGSRLIQDPALDAVILTGSTQTARLFMEKHPGLDLHAETGGKNALIITAMSDRDLAIRDLVQSAFGHNGQKCSACSLAILEAEVYDDPTFHRQFKEAVESLTVGSAWNKSAKITPLIRPPVGALYKMLTELDEGASWLIKPKQDPDNPHLWSPGVQMGIKPGSFFHQNELFGPILGVMRATSFQEALYFANSTPYGLTSGIHTLDEREQEEWEKSIIAGNLYINRGITGAVVRRQPFGGCKASSFGPGTKAGGPNYLLHLASPKEVAPPSDHKYLPTSLNQLMRSLSIFNLSEEQLAIWKKSAESYAYWEEILKEPADPSCLIGQDNYFYHVPLKKAYLHVQTGDSILFLLQVVTACHICETPLEISTQSSLPKVEGFEFIQKSDDQVFEKMEIGSRLRLLSSPSVSFQKKAAKKGVVLQSDPVLSCGRIELLHYLREVSLSIDYHRYGYLGLRDPVFAKK